VKFKIWQTYWNSAPGVRCVSPSCVTLTDGRINRNFCSIALFIFAWRRYSRRRFTPGQPCYVM